MPLDEVFRCPACRAKLRFGRRPNPRVRCPLCGHQFERELPSQRQTGTQANSEPVLDPFLDAAHSSEPAEQTIDPFVESESPSSTTEDADTNEFAEVLRRTVSEPRSAEVQLGPALPLIRPVVKRGPSAGAGEFKKKGDKKKRRRSNRFKPAAWIFAGGAAVVFALIVLVFVFGHRLTMSDIAGTYLCDKNPGIRITLDADGTCTIEDSRLDLSVGEIEYAFDGRKITLKRSEEMKPLKVNPAQLILFLARRGPTMIDVAAKEFDDLTFEHGALFPKQRPLHERKERRRRR